MAAALEDVVIATGVNGLRLVFSQDQQGGFWVRIEDYYQAYSYPVTQAIMEQIAEAADTVATS